MQYREFKPPPHLGHLVKLGWTLSTGATPSERLRYVATPDGCMEIIRRLEGSSTWCSAQPERFVAGLITRPTELELGGRASFIALTIWPWAWNAVASIPSPQLLDRWADLSDAAPALEMPASIEPALTLLEPVTLSEQTTELAAVLPNVRTVEELSKRSGRPHRWLQRWFKREIGIPPRHYLRLLRFQNALVGVQSDAATLADHAAAHGFSDQAHMAREFRAISGEAAHAARKRATGPFL